MKALIIKYLCLAVFIGMGLPFLIFEFSPANWGMMLSIAYLLFICPIFLALTGAILGKSSRKLWFLPLAFILCFALSSWHYLGMPFFSVYLLAYLAIGACSILFSSLKHRSSK